MRFALLGRTSLLLAAVSVAGIAAPSTASSPRFSCRLIQDPVGDAADQPNTQLPGVQQPDLDIISADIASNERSVTTVVRVQNLGTAVDAAGRRNMYRFSFQLGNYGDVVTEAYRGLDGESFDFNVPNEGDDTTRPDLPATGVFDVARNEVRVTIPLMDASGRRIVWPSTRFKRLAADTFRGVGTSTRVALGVMTGVDRANSTRQYRAGSPSCVEVGR